MRKLKYHEQKLLKKVDFIKWNTDKNLYQLQLMRKFYIQKREDLSLYNKYTKHILDLAKKIKELQPEDPFRTVATVQLLEKLYSMGLIPTKRNLALAEKVSAAAFCRRRLPVVMVKAHMAQTVKAATTFVEQGHIRIGPEVCTDPARLVTSFSWENSDKGNNADYMAIPITRRVENLGKNKHRSMEDFLTWTDTSAIKKHVMAYNEQRDDFDLMG